MASDTCPGSFRARAASSTAAGYPALRRVKVPTSPPRTRVAASSECLTTNSRNARWSSAACGLRATRASPTTLRALPSSATTIWLTRTCSGISNSAARSR